jgi:4-amino-4-deoxy-L-arabinose transferase-like glycosyltransferase
VRVLTNEITIDTRPPPALEPAPRLVVLTLILGAILLFRILGLVFASIDLHADEARYWYWSRDIAFGYYPDPPLLMWLIALATAACGDGETCLRLPSAIIFTVCPFLIYALARRLYDNRVAFWSAIVYATLPAVSAFAMVATPESALSLFWIAGLLLVYIHLDRPTAVSGLALGLVVGLGMMTDYSAIYLPLCTALYLALTPKARSALSAPGTWLAVAVAALVLAPNLIWNAQNELVSFGTVTLLADWTFRHLNSDATLVFIGLQFVLFGPILLFVLLRAVLVRAETPRNDSDRFLLFHSMPIFAVLLFQVLFFKARAHWSMPAFPAAAIFVTALLLRLGFRKLLWTAIGLHVAMLAGILGLGVLADRLHEVSSLSRMIGWRQFAEGLDRTAALSDINTIVLQGSDKVAEAIYYLRDTEIEILAFNPRGRQPRDDFERRRSWAYGDPQTVLLATDRDPTAFGIPLGNADEIGEFPVQSWLSDDGMYSLYRVNPPADTTLPQ